jgi:hypothetical protein
MNLDDAEQGFADAVLALEAPNRERAASDGSVRPGSALTVATCRELFDPQLTSRQLDLAARWMQQQGRGYYTISSAGHEGNAAVAAVLRPTDPALLHYRSGAFYVQRASQVAGVDAVRDVLYGVAAAADEPIAGGRHKVFGRAELAVIPQTSTIASHLPRAVGVAFAIGRAQRLGLTTRWPADAIASVGDASMNHSTAAGAINSACLGVYEGLLDRPGPRMRHPGGGAQAGIADQDHPEQVLHGQDRQVGLLLQRQVLHPRSAALDRSHGAGAERGCRVRGSGTRRPGSASTTTSATSARWPQSTSTTTRPRATRTPWKWRS